jgi:hypothetical protein
MVAEPLQQSGLGSPGLHATFHGAAATLGPLWPHYGDVCRIQLTAGELGPEVPARPVRFRRHARRLVGVVLIMFCGRGRG